MKVIIDNWKLNECAKFLLDIAKMNEENKTELGAIIYDSNPKFAKRYCRIEKQKRI